MADPIRAALERLVAVVEQDRRSQHDAMTLIAMADPVGEALDDARAALEAAPSDGPAVPPAEGREPAAVVDEPSDQNLYDFWIATSPELGCADPVGFARAVLARWGRPTTPSTPAAEEVRKLVSWLGVVSEQFRLAELDDEATQTDRAATLLEQLSAQAPQPVAVSERLPEPRDCAPWPDESDASAWCWVGSDVDGGWSWEQRSAGCLAAFPDDFTHWLPAHALPIPQEEAQP